MSAVILFHVETNMETCEGPMEMDVARKYMSVYDSRVLVPSGFVIARFGLLPHYQEMERDLEYRGARLLNSYAQHRWIANLTDWGGSHGVLADMTPQTWTGRWDLLPDDMAFVVKGRTNSKKQSWNTKMFAKDRHEVPLLAARLMEDENLNDQGIVAREYVPLKKLEDGLNGLPITNEWRTFWAVGESGTLRFLGAGFYWKASHPEAAEAATFSTEGLELARKAAGRVAEHVNFFVIDVAEKAAGGWIVIEVNDGQMSGLCGVRADDLYSSLAAAFG